MKTTDTRSHEQIAQGKIRQARREDAAHDRRIARMAKRAASWPGATDAECMAQSLDEQAEREYAGRVAAREITQVGQPGITVEI